MKRLLSIILFMLTSSAAFAAIGVDISVSTNVSTSASSIASPTFTTKSANELLLAFVSADYKSGTNTTVTGVTTTGLTWVLVRRTNGQSGTAEIWRAFAPSILTGAKATATLSQSVAASITVMTFTGVDTTGTSGSGAIGAVGGLSAASGAPSASLVTTRSGSLVLGVGTDWDKATARTIGAGQTMVNQFLATVGDTYWVQRQTNPTPTSGTTVTINDTAPTSDRYNLSVVEILPSVSSVPDLTITKTHTGSFAQGQTGAIYSINVTNVGGVATNGTVTMNDTLPAGLTATAIAGTGWTCNAPPTLSCTRSDVLSAGASYPAITLTVNLASNAAASVTNTATVTGGGETNTANDTANDVTTVVAPPDLTITKTHSGSFIQGQTGAIYTITVTNSGGTATTGTITMIDTLPTGLSATAITGTGWTCTLATLTCTRSNALGGGTSYPAILLTVSVAANSPSSIVNTATVSGGGETNTANDTVNDTTTINPPSDLTVTSTHSGSFSQGQNGAIYTISVTNSGVASTSGNITMVDTLPVGLTASALAGTGWTCSLSPALTCSRSDALSTGVSYPVITLTVNVAGNASASLTNTTTVSGGGELNTSNNSSTDLTAITPVSDLTVTKTHSGNFTQGQSGATYTITVNNIGGAATSGTVTMTDTLPTGLTAIAISGTGWTCNVPPTPTCTRGDALSAGSSYDAITLTVNVDSSASTSVTNSASVSGGGETIVSNNTSTDITTITRVGPAAVTVSTAHYDNSRQGSTASETVLSPANVASSSFRNVGSYTVDGEVYAQPLYIPNVTVGTSTYNLLIIATMHNSIYAFNADVPGTAALWSVNFGATRANGGAALYSHEVGCFSTPVVDVSANKLYAVCSTSTPTWVLRVMNLSTGVVSSSITITGSVAGTGDPTGGDTVKSGVVTFYPSFELQRSPLTLANGKVYVAFTSYSDTHPWHGWIMAYDANTLTQTNIICLSPNGYGASIWEAGGGPAVDARGNLYVVTGNGSYGNSNYSESIMKLDQNLTILDYFTPANYATLDANDQDLGSGRAMLVPGTDIVFAGGKDCKVYAVAASNMGHLQGTGAAPQILTNNSACIIGGHGVFGGMFMNGRGYFPDVDGKVYSYALNGTAFNSTPTTTTTNRAFPGAILAGSSNGTANGIVWATTADISAEVQTAAGTLRAFDPVTLAELYNSGKVAGDTLGTLAKFSSPTVVNGRVYVATQDKKIQVYGLLSATASAKITGTISPSIYGSGVQVAISGGGAFNVTDLLGAFSFTVGATGTYTITPTKAGVTFSPASIAVTVSALGTDPAPVAFKAVTTQNLPDMKVIIQTGAFSITNTGGVKMFNYTHDTENAGAGPLEIQPSFNTASGNYQGVQHIYTLSAGSWKITQSIPIPGAFEFHAAHGHFHFPLSIYGLYTVDPSGGIGTPVVMSTKNGFCIADSFIYDRTLPNSGTFGNNGGTCIDPLAVRGVSIGAVDEYDASDPGQSIDITNLPDGTYWFRSFVDPDNYIVESDETNNEMDVKLVISGNTVSVLQAVNPILTQPPSVAITSPANGATVSGTVQLSAISSNVGGTGVQFLLDGTLLGNVIAGPGPYTFSWNTTTASSGLHWLAAQTTDTTGHTGTSAVVAVTINQGLIVDNEPPIVTLTDPVNNTTVSAIVEVGANVSDNVGVQSVTFYDNGIPIGNPITAPPYMTFWDTQTAAGGPQHVISASAVDFAGNTGTSTSVTVTVDNSHPANLIGKDVTTFVDGQGTMTTPAFSTAVAGDLLVAFVAFDGPSNTPQTATVSSTGGLSWSLLKRSNGQAGTAEIWAARTVDFLSGVTVTATHSSVGTFHGSMTVIAFTNASGVGIVGAASAPTGAPDNYMPGITAGNWVFSVGNDWDGAVARTPVAGQVIVHQRIDTSVGDTFWVQSTTTPSTVNTLVDIHDSAPTNHRWNYVGAEIVATRQ